MSIGGQGHFWPWAMSLIFQNSKVFFSETNGPFETKFHMKAHGRKEKKFYYKRFGHMTKMAAMSIYGKNFQTTRTILISFGMQKYIDKT